MARTKVGIFNVTGYTGVELARLLSRHPYVELVSVTGRSLAGKRLGEVFPHLSHLDLTITEDLDPSVEFVFSALPHGESASRLVLLIKRGVPVVDLSADFRLNSTATYAEWYGKTHPAPELLKEAVYGLTELNRTRIASARLVANPGCYPTSALLALAPAWREGLLDSDVIIDSKSGISGSGRAPSLDTIFCEAAEDVSAYGLSGHRHLPEITQELSKLGKITPQVCFVPHLVPMSRGILSTCYGRLNKKLTVDELRQRYLDFYWNESFVKISPAPPHTRDTRGSNVCLIFPTIDVRSNRLIVVSCLDNLVKGAGGQAIQNMNLMLGFRETAGLEAPALYP